LDYHVVDVFTDRAFAGNPLAVVLGADDLTTAQMQALAMEFNLSETTFPMSSSAGADYRVRIFTPSTELPFAGHPSVGTAWLLHRIGRIAGGAVVQECGAGLLPVEVDATGATLTGGAATLGSPVDLELLCRAVGLSGADAVGTAPRWAGMGLEFVFLHVRPDAVARAVPDLAALGELGGAGVSVFALSESQSAASRAVHARVFAVGAGVPEDPATGSAALGLGVYLVDAGLVAADGETAYVVTQGVEMGRPSTLQCVVSAAGGLAVAGRVRGSVAPVASGQIEVPAVGG
jgi:trans-2,3-dihydro-3-hydroxyanthranilate isomerase